MEDLLLLLIMIAVFAFGYFVMVRANNAFIEENQRLIEQEDRENHSQNRIDVESEDMRTTSIDCTHLPGRKSISAVVKLIKKRR